MDRRFGLMLIALIVVLGLVAVWEDDQEQRQLNEQMARYQAAIDSSLADTTSLGDVAPTLLQFVAPEYVLEARTRGLEGTVAVKILVGKDGRVLEAEVMTGVHELLDAAALAAAEQTIWTPGRRGGDAAICWMALPYNFALKVPNDTTTTEDTP